MKKLFIISFVVMMMLVACGQSDAEKKVEGITIDRYDRIECRYLTTGDYSALQTMNTDYTMQTRTLIEDVIQLGSVSDPNINKEMLQFFQDSLLQQIISDAEVQYAKVDDIEEDLKKAFRNLLKEFPDAEIPKFYSQITALDQSIVVDGNAIGISLDKYLGADYPVYKRFYSEEQRQSMTREFIVPDCIVFYLFRHYPISEYELRTQEDFDAHAGIVMWIANRFVGREAFTTENVKKVERYMKKHKDVSILELLQMKDFKGV